MPDIMSVIWLAPDLWGTGVSLMPAVDELPSAITPRASLPQDLPDGTANLLPVTH
ncbi:hypothetical protein ML401_01145 [Bradyrhizobium sp. 62B]|uniref:hypothetical protein n=1 Tax=Bradyrhizobium sp. 62B TaxID=2898442 RepID=UPI002557CBAF|nr:hypothetical protein ML401_01145 [Bradyrhizobium sp. 62B]